MKSFVLIFTEGAFACLPQMERGRACVLGADPKGKNFLYCSGRYVFIRDVNVSC